MNMSFAHWLLALGIVLEPLMGHPNGPVKSVEMCSVDLTEAGHFGGRNAKQRSENKEIYDMLGHFLHIFF